MLVPDSAVAELEPFRAGGDIDAVPILKLCQLCLQFTQIVGALIRYAQRRDEGFVAMFQGFLCVRPRYFSPPSFRS